MVFYIKKDTIPDWKIAVSKGKNVNFNPNIRMKNGRVTIEIIPKNNMFLESLVLKREY